MFLILAGIAACYLFYKWAIANYDYFEKKGIPYLKPYFLVGSNYNMFFDRKNLPEVVIMWYKNLPSARLQGMFEFRKPMFLVRDPKLAKQLAVKDFDHFVDHRTIVDESVDKMIGNSLFSLKGQKWRDMRATLSPMFTGSKMRMMYKFVADVGQQTAKTMREQINAGSDNVFEFKALATKYTVDVIATCAFGLEVNSFKDPNNEFAKIANEATNFGNFWQTMKFIALVAFPSLMKSLKVKFFSQKIEDFFHIAVKETMTNREEKGIVRNDMIHLLMQARKGKLTHDVKESEKVTDGFATVEESQMGKTKVERVWSDEDLAAQAFIFFFAGFETVATTMGFMAYELSVNPEVQQKLYEEIEATENELDGESIGYDKIQGLKYMDQCVCETLRKWPAAPGTDRVCTKDITLDLDGQKVTIEEGKIIFIPIQGYHHDPKFFPEPEKFIPERFGEENRGNIDPDTYLPFGIGPRNCIGSRFALMEVKTVFYYLLLNFKLEVNEKSQVPLKLRNNPLRLQSEKGIWMTLKPRK